MCKIGLTPSTPVAKVMGLSNLWSSVGKLVVTAGVLSIALWLNVEFRTSFREQKFGGKPGTFDL